MKPDDFCSRLTVVDKPDRKVFRVKFSIKEKTHDFTLGEDPLKTPTKS